MLRRNLNLSWICLYIWIDSDMSHLDEVSGDENLDDIGENEKGCYLCWILHPPQPPSAISDSP